MSSLLLIAILQGQQIAPAAGSNEQEAVQPDSIIYYDVRGTTSAQVRDQLNKLGPLGSDGKRHDAKTTWGVRWRFLSRTTATACELREQEVRANVVFTMPRWANVNGASASVSQRWRDYYAALLVHEEGHARLAQQAATTVREAFARLPGNVPCATLREQYTQVYNVILGDFKAKQQDYDEETKHGRTQGAVFP